MQPNKASENQMDLPQSLSGVDSSTETPVNKLTGSHSKSRRTTIRGRNNARKTPSVESFDSSAEEEQEETQYFKLAWKEGSKHYTNVG
ncbi:uncharacterized protein LOC110929576 [Helianthus annuus]|uniref:uncharacterized protein LOC110868805 n=1 Tax=Helianthus annuus TaxID=4232 RepID=UPI0016532E37|nr:uncharacterized protein LOC110868805 [Helianthus annuus]XP_035844329.1 uncharacterized protein LOC110929576 [Helianthus annuus]